MFYYVNIACYQSTLARSAPSSPRPSYASRALTNPPAHSRPRRICLTLSWQFICLRGPALFMHYGLVTGLPLDPPCSLARAKLCLLSAYALSPQSSEPIPGKSCPHPPCVPWSSSDARVVYIRRAPTTIAQVDTLETTPTRPGPMFELWSRPLPINTT